MGKESQTHAEVNPCGGQTIKLHYIVRNIRNIKLHSYLQCSFNTLGVRINLRLDFPPLEYPTPSHPFPLHVQLLARRHVDVVITQHLILGVLVQ